MKHKKLFITLTAIFTVLLALVIFIMIWHWGDTYKGGANYDGFEDFREEIAIPGLNDGACPQGIGSYSANDKTYFFISAYFKEGTASRIYVVEKDGGEIGYVTLKNTDGSVYDGHCGGVATNGFTLWVASGRKIYVAQKTNSSATSNIALDIINLAQSNGELQFSNEFNANLNAAFLYFYDADGVSSNRGYNDRLYVGEFYRAGNYETDAKHRLTTKNGENNTAFMYEYNISTVENEFGLTTLDAGNLSGANVVPKVQAVYSVTGEIQGVARTRDTSAGGNEEWRGGLVLSQSYGLKNSRLYYYDWSKITANSNRTSYKDLTYKNAEGKDVAYGSFEYEGVKTNSGAPYYYTDANLYVYYVDGSALLNTYSIPSMSEGMCVVGDRVYVLFESAAKKYRLFVREALDHVYSFIPRNKR